MDKSLFYANTQKIMIMYVKNTYLSEVTSCIPSNLEIFWGLGYLNLAGKVISPKLTSKASHQTESHLNSNVLLIIKNLN